MKMDTEGDEHFVIPSSVAIVKRLNFLAIEIHNGYSAELISLMSNLGFYLERTTKKSYFGNSFKAAMFHPRQTCEIYKQFKSSGKYSGIRKISRGIEISNSSDLVVGMFVKKGEK